jgi:hypothetical protein
MSGQYKELDRLHSEIAGIQKGLSTILDQIILGDPFSDIPQLGEYQSLYNSFPQSKVVDHGDFLVQRPSVDEEDYLSETMLTRYRFIPSGNKWTEAIRRDLAICLIEYLLPVDNKKYISECLNCGRYFIVTKLNKINPQKFCRYDGDSCRHVWNNKRRIASGDAARYLKEGRMQGKYQ